MSELPDAIYSEIRRLCSRGDKYADLKQYSEALQDYWAAWRLLPEPKVRCSAATWILVAIGDFNFLTCDYAAGRDTLKKAERCPDGYGDPFLYLRLGQCHLELEDFERAADALMRAYVGGGPEIFRNQDPKYHRFLQSRDKTVLPPKKPWQFWR